ncbi:MAG: deoxyribodipyrimidine photolyase [Deltaproteobacteria bacterium]|nr:deoxyribodipyrimidine photolyase [Deltaproteobacteria bacterium]
MESRVPDLRVRVRSPSPVNPDGRFVLYWMLMGRRPAWNFALDRAVEWASELKKPLVVFEGVRLQYPWASDRLHRFLLDGMRDNLRAFAAAPACYYPYVETAPDAGKGLVRALAGLAAVVVTDDYPAFMIPAMTEAAARQSPVRFEQVDSNGLLPMQAAGAVYPTAYAFRRFLQKELPAHLLAFPRASPLKGVTIPALDALPAEITGRWPAATAAMLEGGQRFLASLPIDHRAGAAGTPGGFRAGRKQLGDFLGARLPRYPEDRSEPEKDGGSGLSPYLHFGHVSAHEIADAVFRDAGWSPQRLGTGAQGRKEGWWGLPPAAEAFLDELVTWRELGFNFCSRRDDYDRYESLPDWALHTLARHAGDRRPHVYRFEEFDGARTHDALWNAAQSQLVREGRMHNYLRMLWGKKILEWSEGPSTALATMIELNNRYALDGRDPNSYSGIFWVLGRYDRPWGPERPIFGTVRYMSSENTARKFSVKNYIRKYAPDGGGQGALL